MSFERNRDEPLSLSLSISRYSTFAIAWKDRFRPMIFKRQKEAARNVKTYVNDVVNGIASPLLSTLLTEGKSIFIIVLFRPSTTLNFSYGHYYNIILIIFYRCHGRSPAIVKPYARIMNFGPRFRRKRPFIYIYISVKTRR